MSTEENKGTMISDDKFERMVSAPSRRQIKKPAWQKNLKDKLDRLDISRLEQTSSLGLPGADAGIRPRANSVPASFRLNRKPLCTISETEEEEEEQEEPEKSTKPHTMEPENRMLTSLAPGEMRGRSRSLGSRQRPAMASVGFTATSSSLASSSAAAAAAAPEPQEPEESTAAPTTLKRPGNPIVTITGANTTV